MDRRANLDGKHASAVDELTGAVERIDEPAALAPTLPMPIVGLRLTTSTSPSGCPASEISWATKRDRTANPRSHSSAQGRGRAHRPLRFLPVTSCVVLVRCLDSASLQYTGRTCGMGLSCVTMPSVSPQAIRGLPL